MSSPPSRPHGHRPVGPVTPRAAANEVVEASAPRALVSGVRTSLRENATAYGFSVSITAAFGLVSTQHPSRETALPVLLFAAAAALTFLVIEVGASRLFADIGHQERTRVVFISGAVDGIAVLCSVGAAVGLATIPGVLAWPATSAGTVLVFLVVGGLDVLIARAVDHRTSDGSE